jgi:transposase
MQDYIHEQRDWLTVERLPGYAPDLNPVETLWGNIKGQELASCLRGPSFRARFRATPWKTL